VHATSCSAIPAAGAAFALPFPSPPFPPSLALPSSPLLNILINIHTSKGTSSHSHNMWSEQASPCNVLYAARCAHSLPASLSTHQPFCILNYMHRLSCIGFMVALQWVSTEHSINTTNFSSRASASIPRYLHTHPPSVPSSWLCSMCRECRQYARGSAQGLGERQGAGGAMPGHAQRLVWLGGVGDRGAVSSGIHSVPARAVRPSVRVTLTACAPAAPPLFLVLPWQGAQSLPAPGLPAALGAPLLPLPTVPMPLAPVSL